MVPEFHNRTRESDSIPRTLFRRGRLLDIPLYYLLRTSDLAREGLENSGSYRFADHIYRDVPSGTNALGCWIDAQLLAMPSVRSFRSRFLAARDELARFLCEHSGAALDVLSVPCGIPRELAEGAALARQQCADISRVVFHGLDLDRELLGYAQVFACEHGIDNFQTHHCDALSRSSYPTHADFVTSTGLADFLDDEKLLELYSRVYEVLRPGGTFVSSGMQRRRAADYLLRIAEIRAHYRGHEKLEALARAVGFQNVTTRYDALGIQCILVAKK